MKTTVLFFVFLSIVVSSINCQQDTTLMSKNKRIILPQKNDIAIGVSTNSIFNYIGNLFNNSEHNYLNLKLLQNSQIFGKYFLSENTALNVRLGILMTDKDFFYASDYWGSIPVNEKYSNLSFAAGYEKRIGKNRLQLAYGSEINMTFSKVNYSYNRVHFNPPRTKQPHEIELRGYVGIEYFFAPKISVGGQYGLGIAGIGLFQKKFKDNILINTDTFGGQIYMLFHFEI
jgi:hypothetical protein